MPGIEKRLTLKAVLPLDSRSENFDEARAEMFFETLNWNCPELLLDEIQIVHTDRAEELAHRLASLSRHRVFCESESAWLDASILDGQGWYKQQIVKILAARLLECHGYLCLDSDLLLLKPLRREHLIDAAGRVSVNPQRAEVHQRWWNASAKILEVVPPEADQGVIGVTPTMIYTRLMANLVTTLEEKLGNWQQHLIKHKGWTEYTLYWLSCTDAERDSYHQMHTLHRDNVWQVHDADRWDPGDTPEDSPFAVLNSNTGICPEMIREKLNSSEL